MVTATSEIYPLSLHDALPICHPRAVRIRRAKIVCTIGPACDSQEKLEQLIRAGMDVRSEEHTSELQSLAYLVCRLLLEKKKPMQSSRVSPCGLVRSEEHTSAL